MTPLPKLILRPAILLPFLLLAFAALAGAVAMGWTRAMDDALLLALRDPLNPADPLGPPWFEEAVRDVTALGSNVVLYFLTAAIAAALFLAGRPRPGWLIILAMAAGALLNSGTKLVFARPRPDIVPHEVTVYTNSFPSGHALLSAIFYLTLAVLFAQTAADRRVKALVFALAFLLTFAIGASRVYLGVHWPTDVLAGWLLGGAWAAGCWAFFARRLG